MILEVSGLSISLGGKAILRDVSCDVQRGDFLCVVGRNGAGKSTFFKCVCGAYKNFQGTVRLAGRDSATISARERARIIAYVPQSAPPMPYTVHDFMEMSRYPWKSFFGSSWNDRRAISEAIALADIGAFTSRKMRDLSGGERQKVMIASAIAQESDAILMDEPTTFLDYAHQAEMAELMTRVNRERNVTMLVVTHDVNLAMRISDKVLGFSEGCVKWLGTPCGLQNPELLRSIFGVAFEQYVPERKETQKASPLFVPELKLRRAERVRSKVPSLAPRDPLKMKWGRIALFLTVSLVALLLCPWIGVRTISPFDLGESALEARIFWQLRVPRVLMAWCAGATFGICGMVFQAMFRNPLAEPSLLGISSGAALGAAIAIRLGLTEELASLTLPVSAFLGAMASIAVISTFAQFSHSARATLLLAGVAISALFSSLIMVLQYTSSASETYKLLSWTMGGINAVGMKEGLRAIPSLCVAMSLALYYSTELDLMTFGDEIATSKGVDLEKIKWIMFVGMSVSIAIVVANCGPVAFLGLIAPHVARGAAARHLGLTILTALVGGAALLVCDTIARTVWAPADLPVGIIVSFLGAPFFLWLLFRARTQ